MKPATAFFVLVAIMCATSFILGMLYQSGQSRKPINLYETPQFIPSPTPEFDNVGRVGLTNCAIPFMPTPEPSK